MNSTTSVNAFGNISLIHTENTSLLDNYTMSLNFTKQEEVDGGADLPTLAKAYITYKIGKLRNFQNHFKN